MNWQQLIKTARERLGETQEEFAARFAVSPNTVSRWESGTYKVSLEAVDWIFKHYLNQQILTCPTCHGKGLIEQLTEAES